MSSFSNIFNFFVNGPRRKLLFGASLAVLSYSLSKLAYALRGAPLVSVGIPRGVVQVLLGGGGRLPRGSEVLLQFASHGCQTRPLQRCGEPTVTDAGHLHVSIAVFF